MTDQRSTSDVAVIADLNDLLQLDRDATEAYTVAINSVRNAELRESLVAHRADHKRHADELASLVRDHGGMAIELPHITAPIKMVLQAMGGATMRDANVLFSLRIVEGQVREQYARYASHPWPEDVEPVVRRAAADEELHYRWILHQLEDNGYGDQSLAGSVGAAAEAIHNLFVTPIETLGKQFMRVVNETNPWSPTSRMSHNERSVGAGSATALAENFGNALRAVEERTDLAWMASLFAPGAQLTGPLLATTLSGPAGVSEFWTAHANTFSGYRTAIDQVIPAHRAITLKWTASVESDNTARSVQGVTVIEHQAGRITKLQEFFDPASIKRAS